MRSALSTFLVACALAGAAHAKDETPVATIAVSSSNAGSSLGDRDYMDIAVTWNFWKKWTFRAGINNVFDRDPPLCDSGTACAPPFGNGNTYPQVYDAAGRKFFTGLTVNF